MSFSITPMSCGAYSICVQQETFHVMPCVVAHAANPNDVMCTSCDMHEPASWASLSIHDAPQYMYCHGVHMCCMTCTKINHFTFSCPK